MGPARLALRIAVAAAVALMVARTRKASGSAKAASRPATPGAQRFVRGVPSRTGSVRVEPMGIGWQTDYPYAEINLTTRLSELTKTRVSRDGGGHRTTSS